MRFNALFKLLIITGFTFCYLNSSAQKVKEDFINPALYENFDTEQGSWQTTNNIDNFFLIQNGEYILERKNQKTPYAILADWSNNLKEFAAKASLRIDLGSLPESSIGLIVTAQADRRGAFFIEIGVGKKYRVRKLDGIDYKFMTGNPKEQGWVKSSTIKEAAYNLIDVKVLNGNFDFYINNKFLASFSEPSYGPGDIGLMIGPGTKAKADFFYVYSNENKAYQPGAGKEGEPKINSNDMMALTDAIVKLKTKINKLTDENADLKKQIAILESGARKEDNSSEELSSSNKKLQKQLENLKFSNDSLIKINRQLNKYKEIVSGNENADLVISLSSSLQKEKAGNLILNNQNKQLLDSIRVLNGMPPSVIKENKVSQGTKPVVPKKTEPIKPKDKKGVKK
jgi:hypothetical protein